MFVILDEMPVVAMLDAQGNIHSERYPNIAQFADNATWYTNTVTRSCDTLSCIPAILTGKRPQTGLRPRLRDYPNNLFTLLSGQYSFNAHEMVTRLCPRKLVSATVKRERSLVGKVKLLLADSLVVFGHVQLPIQYTSRLPSIEGQWGDFLAIDGRVQTETSNTGPSDDAWDFKPHDRVHKFKQFISLIDGADPSTLHYLHILLPPMPWRLLPSGRIYPSDQGIYIQSELRPPPLRNRMQQALLVQLSYTDKLVGDMIARLKEAGVYDDALIVIVSDHGISLRQGALRSFSRRSLDGTNTGELLFVPLFIKFPGQEQGKIVDDLVETLDVFPTIAKEIGVDDLIETDGRALSLTGRQEQMQEPFEIVYPDHVFTRTELMEARKTALERQIRLFHLDDERSTLFNYGPGIELVGKEIAPLLKGESTTKIKCGNELEQLRNFDPASPSVASYIIGDVEWGPESGADHLLAFAVNGVVRGVTSTFQYEDADHFEILLSDEFFVPGQNEVDVYVADNDHNLYTPEVEMPPLDKSPAQTTQVADAPTAPTQKESTSTKPTTSSTTIDDPPT